MRRAFGGVLVLVVACDGGGECRETRREVGYDEAVVGEDSARSLTAGVGVKFLGELRWRGGGGDVVVTPSMGTTELVVSLEYTGGEVWLIEREGHDLAPNERLACSDELALAATLTLHTEDGALLGSRDVEARHAIGGGPTLAVEVRPFTDVGSFSVAEEALLRASFHPDAASGEISVAAADGESGPVLATWSASVL